MNIAGRHKALLATQLSMEPVLVNSLAQDYDVPLSECQVTRVLGIIGVEGFGTGHLRHQLLDKSAHTITTT